MEIINLNAILIFFIFVLLNPLLFLNDYKIIPVAIGFLLRSKGMLPGDNVKLLGDNTLSELDTMVFPCIWCMEDVVAVEPMAPWP